VQLAQPRFREIVDSMLSDPTLSHVYFDIPGRGGEIRRVVAGSHPQYGGAAQPLPDRIMFGTDNVAPADRRRSSACSTVGPDLGATDAEASLKIRKGTMSAFRRGPNPVRAWKPPT